MVVVAKLKHTGCSLIKLYQIKNVNISESYIYILFIFGKLSSVENLPGGIKIKFHSFV